MRKLLFPVVLLVCSAVSARCQMVAGPKGERFSVRTVACGLSDPWEVSYGPDGWLWVTESKGYRVSRIHPVTGEQIVLLDLTHERKFPRYDQLKKQSGGKPWPQGGLMGMALHPGLLADKPYVYLLYVWRYEGADSAGSGCKAAYGGCVYQGRLVRYVYRAALQKLTDPVVLCDTIPQSSDHNGGRLAIMPIDGRDYLFYSVGDMGAGQFDNGGRPNHAQDTSFYEGKILRFNTEPDADADPYDRWIPNDNPFSKEKQSAVWTYGHRNPQGLVYAVTGGSGKLYSSEHGPYSDDEVNIIEKGKNYGHPLVIGFADGNYDGLAASVSHHDSLPGRWHTTYPLITDERAAARSIGEGVYRDPIFTFYANSAGFLRQLFDKIDHGADDVQWPSEAPSSIDVYSSDRIPGWKHSILLSTLKGGKLIRLKLDSTGTRIVGDTLSYFKGRERFRDLALSPDGSRIYLATDSMTVSSGPSAENPTETRHPGCILEYWYVGEREVGRKEGN